jgi:heme/copper-type cytochrome/quinol oxidase subunit 2
MDSFSWHSVSESESESTESLILPKTEEKHKCIYNYILYIFIGIFLCVIFLIIFYFIFYFIFNNDT